jgi:hypothetical protein
VITLDSLQGHWVRRWIKAPGFEDETTRVHWMQVGAVYADVRIPVARPDLTGKRALSDLSADQLLLLAGAEGFAGSISLEGANCTWHREINWHGATDIADVGEIGFDALGRMVETGVLAEYKELWEQHAGGAAGRAIRASGDEYEATLVQRSETFVLGIGRSGKASTVPLVEGLKSGVMATDIADVFDGLHAVGELTGDVAVAELATQPFVEGQPVATVHEDRLIWHRIGFDGARQDIAMPLLEIVLQGG